MAKNKDTSNINRSGIYDHTDRTITFFDPKKEEPPKVFSVESIFAGLNKKEISVTWAVVSDGVEVSEDDEDAQDD